MTTFPQAGVAAFSPWVAFGTLLQREVMRYLKLAVQTIVAPFLSNLLFLAVFGGLLSQRSSGIPGVGYVELLVPGLVLMGTIISSFSNPVFSIIAMKYQNTIQDLCLYPLSTPARFFAFTLAGMLRGVLVGAMTFAAAAPFGGGGVAHPALFWGYVALVAFVASAGGLAVGLGLDSFEHANFVISLLLMPALFLGGVFFDAAAAPSWLGLAASIDPLTSIIGAGRWLFLGVGRAGSVATACAGVGLGALAVVAGVLAVRSGRGMKAG